MRTVSEVSRLTGVSVRTLHYYDQIGLLSPSASTDAGYRLYDDEALRRLQQIMLFRELEFPLERIRGILNSSAYNRAAVLEQQIALLKMRRERLDRLISLAERIKETGGTHMSFREFDKKTIESYANEAREKWGKTEAYREFEQKNVGRNDDMQNKLGTGLMDIFAAFGELKGFSVQDEKVQAQVKALQDYITANYYTCTKTILSGLGQMYAAGGEMTENIDSAGGEGTALFAAQAIEVYCR